MPVGSSRGTRSGRGVRFSPISTIHQAAPGPRHRIRRRGPFAWSKSDRLALSAAIIVFLAGLISNWGGLLFLSILAAAGVAVVVFLPQLVPTATLPGSRGSLLAALGIVGFAAAALELLRLIGYTLDTLGRLGTLLFLMALIASAAMAWAGWQALQRDGGKWQFGTSQPAAAAAVAGETAATSASEPAATGYDPDDSEPAATAYDPDAYRPRDG
jgi:hypothetical protein